MLTSQNSENRIQATLISFFRMIKERFGTLSYLRRQGTQRKTCKKQSLSPLFSLNNSLSPSISGEGIKLNHRSRHRSHFFQNPM
jgi:hypothetical protein